VLAELADARQAALLAVLRAEQLEDADQVGSDEWIAAAIAAAAAQRQLAVVETRKVLLLAHQAHRTGAANAALSGSSSTMWANSVPSGSLPVARTISAARVISSLVSIERGWVTVVVVTR